MPRRGGDQQAIVTEQVLLQWGRSFDAAERCDVGALPQQVEPASMGPQL
jgi:hypothetical protein